MKYKDLQIMYSQTHFGELLSLIPKQAFRAIVNRHESDKYSKGFKTWDHLLSMIYVQLSKAKSLRELETSFNSLPNKHYHLGVKDIRRSTLGEANQKREVKVFEELANHLISKVHHDCTKDLKELLYLLDSSPIPLSNKQHQWVDEINNRTKGLKVHLLYSPQTKTLSQLSITNSDTNDISEGQELKIESGAIYVFDKGYTDYNWWYKIAQNKSTFVTRFKKNASLNVIETLVIDQQQKERIITDEIVQFKNKSQSKGKINKYQEPLRRITVKREDKDTPLIIATNDLEKPAEQLADLYKKRWDIELFFKWIKQNLKIKRFIGTSENAVKIQIYTAIITYTLALLLKKMKLSKKPLYLFVEELSTLLFIPINMKINYDKRIRKKQKEVSKYQYPIFT